MKRIEFIKKIGGYYSIPLMIPFVLLFFNVLIGFFALGLWAFFYIIDFNEFSKSMEKKELKKR